MVCGLIWRGRYLLNTLLKSGLGNCMGQEYWAAFDKHVVRAAYKAAQQKRPEHCSDARLREMVKGA